MPIGKGKKRVGLMPKRKSKKLDKFISKSTGTKLNKKRSAIGNTAKPKSKRSSVKSAVKSQAMNQGASKRTASKLGRKASRTIKRR